MANVKQKILSGFPCNGGKFFMIITEELAKFTTTNKEAFDKAMNDGFIELQHKDTQDMSQTVDMIKEDI